MGNCERGPRVDIFSRLWSIGKRVWNAMAIEETPEINHVSPLKDVLPKENEYLDLTPKK